MVIEDMKLGAHFNGYAQASPEKTGQHLDIQAKEKIGSHIRGWGKKSAQTVLSLEAIY